MEWTNHLERLNALAKEHKNNEIVGLERIIAIILLYSYFLFIFFYLKSFISKFTKNNINTFIDLYVFSKTILAFFLLHFLTSNNHAFSWYLIALLFYLIVETLIFIITPIWCNTIFPKPRSYKRNTFLLLLNHIEITTNLASLYFLFNCLSLIDSKNNVRAIDYFYFSFTSNSLPGQYIFINSSPCVSIIIFQKLILIIFVVIFFRYNTNFLNRSTK